MLHNYFNVPLSQEALAAIEKHDLVNAIAHRNAMSFKSFDAAIRFATGMPQWYQEFPASTEAYNVKLYREFIDSFPHDEVIAVMKMVQG